MDVKVEVFFRESLEPFKGCYKVFFFEKHTILNVDFFRFYFFKQEISFRICFYTAYGAPSKSHFQLLKYFVQILPIKFYHGFQNMATMKIFQILGPSLTLYRDRKKILTSLVNKFYKEKLIFTKYFYNL